MDWEVELDLFDALITTGAERSRQLFRLMEHFLNHLFMQRARARQFVVLTAKIATSNDQIKKSANHRFIDF